MLYAINTAYKPDIMLFIVFLSSSSFKLKKRMLLATGATVAKCVGKTVNLAFNNQVHYLNNFL